jgi:Carboxypeptidase regulatory-like domain
MRISMKAVLLFSSLTFIAVVFLFCFRASAQTVSSGTVEGTVVDQTGAVVPGVTVEIRNAITGYQQITNSNADGSFRFTNVPFNNYRLTATAKKWTPAAQDITVRSMVPVTAKLSLSVAGATETVTVEGEGTVIENVPNAHSDVDALTLSKLPITMPGSGLSEEITMTATGVVADSNGFYHPLGDHSNTSFQIDGQPENDQQSKNFSTQLPPNAVQSLELITGFPSAEYGEKTSLVVNATTRSGLGSGKPHGTIATSYGSFGTISEEADVGFGSAKTGNFLAFNASRSGRFLDTPEFVPIHDVGNNGSLFDRLDYQPNTANSFHLDLFMARNWFQIPNQFDQPNQDQRQRVVSFDVAPGYQHTFSPRALLTLNGWVREDQVGYFPSTDLFNDQPITVSQHRKLLNLGGKVDFSYSIGKHNLKIGTQMMQTRLVERFGLGVTDPTFNAPCNDPAEALPCTVSGTNSGFLPGLAAFDLTRGGSLFAFSQTGNVEEYAVYVADTINWGNFTLNPGLRVTRYNGPSNATGVQPRLGGSYLIKRSGTVLRASYARSLETPHNENLLLSSSTGAGGLSNVFGAFGAVPLPVGRRNQFNLGFQQAIGKILIIDGDYFWKFTHNAAEFDVLLNTPITFPIMWRKDKLDGFGIRVSTLDLKGLRVNTTMSSGRLRYFGPEIGGLIFNAPLATVFRTDSDDKFYQSTMFQYQWHKKGPWAALTWRYDNGEVASGTASDLQGILGLTADQQAQIGFFCGGDVATPTHKIDSCNLPFPQFGAARVRIPVPGTADDDRNPPRVTPRTLFDLGFGTDDLFMKKDEHKRISLHFTIVNLTNKTAMYNFLSTFGGTHFVQPRTYSAQLGFHF